MKKIMTLFSILIVCSSCIAQTIPGKKPSKAPKQAQTVKVSKAEIETGKQLIAGSDCFACHKIDERTVGPSYTEVAKKYPLSEKNINMLSEKVIKGGSGVWGQIPMAPHSSITDEDAKKMVKYILSLNSK